MPAQEGLKGLLGVNKGNAEDEDAERGSLRGELGEGRRGHLKHRVGPRGATRDAALGSEEKPEDAAVAPTLL